MNKGIGSLPAGNGYGKAPAPLSMKRTGEKAGWLGGWLGGFSWVPVLSAVGLAQGKIAAGLAGLAIFLLAVAGVILLAPWRRPFTPYWRLMLPLYAVFAASVFWAMGSFGWQPGEGTSRALLLSLLPCFIPLLTAGRSRWIRRGQEPSR